ncbi:terpene synthase family protein, partial [Crossiella equi]
AATVEEQLLDWALSSGLLPDERVERRFRNARFGECAALCYPDATDLLVYAKWMTWLFVADDEFDENRAPEHGGIDRGVLGYLPLDGAPAWEPTSAVTAALVELWREIAAPMPRPLQERFREHTEEYCRSYAEPLAKARTGQAPHLQDYVDLRRRSGAVETCVDLIERQPQAYLHPVLATAPAVTALRLAANDVICWTNDVLSVGKEVSHGELNNLVAVLQGGSGMNWPAAVSSAAAMTSARTKEFDELAEALMTEHPEPAVRAFVDGIKVWISGSLVWHLDSPRYANRIVQLPPQRSGL